MQLFISPSKLMSGGIVPRLIPGGTEPAFERNANSIAMRLARYSPEELQAMLHCNAKIARENCSRYRRFVDPATRRPAIFNYIGMVFQKIEPEVMSDADLAYANDHLFIGSFIYGLLRPLDLINQYRLEGNVELAVNGGHITIFDYWKPILTDWLIERVKADDGVLVNLASNEFTNIFDWNRMKAELTVISPQFKVEKEGKLRNVTIYAKMCRGAMTRWIIMNRLTSPERLRDFEYEGFTYEGDWRFTLRP